MAPVPMLSVEARMDRAKNFILAAVEKGCYAFDIEHPPELEFSKPNFRLCGCSFSTRKKDGEEFTFYETDISVVKMILETLFKKSTEAIAFNGKYDLKCLVAAGVIHQYDYPEVFVDPMVAVNLLDDNRSYKLLGLKKIMLDLYGIEMMSFESAWSFGENSIQFCHYAMDDARQELFLWEECKPKLEKENLLNLFSKVLMPAAKVFADMELVGILWDLKNAKEQLHAFQKVRDRLEEDIYKEIGKINLNSGDQVAKRLFEELKYPTAGVPMTKSGKRHAVDKDTMEQLAKKFPVCRKIHLRTTANKMISTYVEPCSRRALEDPNNRIHPSFWLVSTTGRTRSDDPNFQNIPAYLHYQEEFKGLNIRDNVVAAPGWKFLVADLSQIELRLIAHITQDRTFLEAYLNWQCTACGDKGASTDILHACPKCGTLEDEAILTTCPKCKALHVKVLKDKETKEVLGCGVCHLKKDYETEVKLRGFWHGLDLHQITTDSVPALLGSRQNGKAANFALCYYATAYRMHYEHPSLSVRQWQQVIDQYFRKYPGVRRWHVQMEYGLDQSGVCKDIFGRKRRIPKMSIRTGRKHALNQFINFSPQASACEMLELAMSRLRASWIESKAWLEKVKIVNMVHDELIFEIKEDFIPLAVPDIQYQLEHVVKLRVPCRTSMNIVDRWGACK